ncbi:MAG: hypothetical protein LBV12_10655 [Puniceicoccales bacterium]|jgi:hypothetical protein|nr:hypothetical protein [Puniceicoccales bacterium]
MMEKKDSSETLLKQASTIYAGLIFSGCIDGWENIDAVFRSDSPTLRKIDSLRYEFSQRLFLPNVSERLRGHIEAFMQASV